MINDQSLDELYFGWLYEQVETPLDSDPSQSHVLLCRTLFDTPFECLVERDENREEEGRLLREEFLDEVDLDVDPLWLRMNASIFEVMLVLARKASFQSGDPADEWFWIMCENSNLAQYTDDVYDSRAHRDVQTTLRRIVHRRYSRTGRGGFFPLRNAREDQRSVELWYQLSAYLIENVEFDQY